MNRASLNVQNASAAPAQAQVDLSRASPRQLGLDAIRLRSPRDLHGTDRKPRVGTLPAQKPPLSGAGTVVNVRKETRAKT